MEDPQREEKIKETCEVYAKAKERVERGERTISHDEMTGVQALERIYPDLSMQPASPEVSKGRVTYQEFEYERHGTLSLFINLDVATGKVISPSYGPTRNEEDMAAHVQKLIESDPTAIKWHFVTDNLNIHQSEALVCLIAKMEGIPEESLGKKEKYGILKSMKTRAAFLHDSSHKFVFYYTPKHGSWMKKA